MRRRDRVDHRRAGHDVLVQLVAAKVEEAVGEARLLRVLLLAEDRQRQLGCGPEHLHLGRVDLDRTRWQIGVFGSGRAPPHGPVEAHDPFRAHRLGRPEGGRIRVDHDLGQAVMVAQIDELDAAMVADAVAPAREADARADVAVAERAAGVGAVTVHGLSGGSRRTIHARRPKSRRGPAFAGSVRNRNSVRQSGRRRRFSR